MANGEIHDGSTFTGRTFGDGCIFTNCTFFASCKFGKGCTFVGCNFVWKRRQPMHYVAEGASFDGCRIDWTQLEGNSSIGNSTLLTVVLGPNVVKSGPRIKSGQAVDVTYPMAQGAQLANTAPITHDWCSYRCVGGRYILGNANSQSKISGNYYGTEWSE